MCFGQKKPYTGSLTPPCYIEVPVPSHERDRSCIWVLKVSILTLSMTFLLDFELLRQYGVFCLNFLPLYLIIRKQLYLYSTFTNLKKYELSS